jgi:hypothetical protein
MSKEYIERIVLVPKNHKNEEWESLLECNDGESDDYLLEGKGKTPGGAFLDVYQKYLSGNWEG